MCKDEKGGWVWMCFLLILIFLAWLITGNRKIRPEGVPIIQKDTIILRDTLIVAEPVEIIKERRIEVHDTIRIAVRDTIRRNDTTFIQIPREVRVYAGDEYRCEVSGVEPRLDHIEIYPETRIVRERYDPKWAVTFQVGVGVDGHFRPTPTLSVGVSRIIWSFGGK